MKKPLKIEFKPYNKNYSSYFQKEKAIIKKLGKFEIHHVGSTAVFRMPGKPEIDILIILKTEKQRKNLLRKLINIGYNKTKIKYKNRLFLFREKNKYIFNLHLMLVNCRNSRDQIKFRNYLRKNPEEFKKYLELKKKNFKKAKADHVTYRELKKGYFKRVLRKI